MSMLAEPRRKQRWTLNPRGKQWSDDQSKFGQKMLEKMGWTAGKGLGVNEQGMTEHIRVKYKDDQAGIGYSKDTQDKLWTEHQEGFNDLLNKLQSGSGSIEVAESANKLAEKDPSDDLSGKSLEMKSKQSRARVHYHKFTRGKDVNRYSTKDLANIFGKKDLANKPEDSKDIDDAKISAEKKAEEEPKSVGSADKTAGILTIKGGTMTDYFKNKIPLISSITKRGSSTISKNYHSKAADEIENEGGEGDEKEEEEEDDEDEEHKENRRISLAEKNHRVSEKDSESESERNVGFGYSSSNNLNPKSPADFKSPRSTNLSTPLSFYAFTNPALDLNSPKSTPKKRKSEFYCSTPSTEDKKLKKDKQVVEDYQEESEQTPKKRKTEFFAFENPGLDLKSPESSLPSTPLTSRPKMEVSRAEITLAEFLAEEEDNAEHKESSDQSKKKKKKKKKEVFNEGIINDALNVDDKTENSVENNCPTSFSPTDVSFTPILRNKMEVLRSEVDCNSPQNEGEREESSESSKKKKKKKKKEPSFEGFVNTALNFDDEALKDDQEMSNKASTNFSDSFEVSRNDVLGLANDALDLTDEISGKKRVTFNDVVEYNTDVDKKKRKKKKINAKLDKFEVDVEKTKKKKKKVLSNIIGGEVEVSSFVNKALEVEVFDEEMLENEENERKMNKDKRKRERSRRMSNLETIEELIEEEEHEQENYFEQVDAKMDDSLVRNASDNLEEMCLNTPIKKKKKKASKKNENSDDQMKVDESAEEVQGKKIKKVKNYEENSVESIEEVNGDVKLKKKKKKSKEKSIFADKMEIDEEVGEENSNKENENSHVAKDSKDFYSKKEKKKCKEKKEVIQIAEGGRKTIQVSEVEEVNEESGANGDVCMNNEAENNDDDTVVERTQFPSKSKRPKKIFKALFAKTPVVYFQGSNINEIKGYGMS